VGVREIVGDIVGHNAYRLCSPSQKGY